MSDEQGTAPARVRATATTESPGTAPMTPEQLRKGFLLAVVVGITVLFLVMVRAFIVGVTLAGVFAAMSRPLYLRLEARLGGRRRLAALVTVIGLASVVVGPVGAFLTLVVTQAVELADTVGPWLRSQSGRWPEVTAWLQALPLVGDLMPPPAEITTRVSDLVARSASLLIDNVRAATTGTLNVVLQLFVLLYALYFFLLDGPRVLSKILYYAPLDDKDERRLIAQFVSVTRATIKGSILVGLLQGALAGGAFFALRIPGAAFWSTVMAVLSIIPVLGSGIVWVPASVILMATGRVPAGVGLALWGLLVVGLVDNFVRPRLVGRDTKMHDVLVLLSTFGGLAMFGLVGFILGPIIAALFLTAWDLYGAAFRELLPSASGLDEPTPGAAPDPAPTHPPPRAGESSAPRPEEGADGVDGGEPET